MTNSPEALKRLEEWADALDPGRERHDGDHPSIKQMQSRADDLRTLLTAYRAQAALLEEAEARLKANEWELADYAKTVGKLRDDALTCPSCGYISHAERFL
jgi:hypothetical protein